jgi:two-component system sensor histidine kinase LytS
MDFLDLDWLFRGLGYSAQLTQRVCVVVVAAFVCIRLQWVRRALRGTETDWRHRLPMALAFGGLGVIATHSGIVMDVELEGVTVADWAGGSLGAGLGQHQAIVGFRDTMVMAGGLVGGPWVGLGAGMIAGYERYLLGGFAGPPSGLATLLLGLGAGVTRQRLPNWAATPTGAFSVALAGTLLHRLLILFLARSQPFAPSWDWESLRPDPLAVALSLEILLAVAMVNCLGCVLFIWVMRDLDSDRLNNELRETRWREEEAELRTRQAEQREQVAHLLKHAAELREQEAQLLHEKAELRALRAQVKPHFLNNIFNSICMLISVNPNLAQVYVDKLAVFFNATRCFAAANSITVREELAQLERYLELQRLRFDGQVDYQIADIPAELLDCHLTPLSLLTLAENALDHGMKGRPDGILLKIEAEDLEDCLALRVIDNGCGISVERLAKLGREPVKSSRPDGSGVALHLLSRSLQLAFPGRASLSIASQLGLGTEVVLTFPKVRSEE